MLNLVSLPILDPLLEFFYCLFSSFFRYCLIGLDKNATSLLSAGFQVQYTLSVITTFLFKFLESCYFGYST